MLEYPFQNRDQVRLINLKTRYEKCICDEISYAFIYFNSNSLGSLTYTFWCFNESNEQFLLNHGATQNNIKYQQKNYCLFM
jgi:hypothetical protein